LRNSQHFFNRTNTLSAFPHNILTKAIKNKNFSQHETPSFILKEVPYLYHAYIVSPPSLKRQYARYKKSEGICPPFE